MGAEQHSVLDAHGLAAHREELRDEVRGSRVDDVPARGVRFEALVVDLFGEDPAVARVPQRAGFGMPASPWVSGR